MKTYIEYAILGKDDEWSKAPVTITAKGEIRLDDAMYDLADYPLYMEAIYLGFPELEKGSEYFSKSTRLFMRLEDK